MSWRTGAFEHVEERGLHVCPFCQGKMVYPLDWSEEGPSHWRIVLRCPDCGQVGTGVFSQIAVERFDAELERAGHSLLADLRHLTQENMTHEVDVFVKALDLDLLSADDFREHHAIHG